MNAPGFDRTVIPLSKKNGIITCVGTHDTKDQSICDLALSHGYLDGSIALSAATITPLTAQVVAEDRGTANLKNEIAVTIPAGQTTASFSGTNAMFVPDQADDRFISGTLTGLDLYALVEDDINGVSQSNVSQANTGHSIPVEAAVPLPPRPPSACATVTASPLADITCVGHGSIDGSLADATSATTAVLEKPDPNNPSDFVQLISGAAGPYGADDLSGYALCAPAEDYILQRFDDGIPGTFEPGRAGNTGAAGSGFDAMSGHLRCRPGQRMPGLYQHDRSELAAVTALTRRVIRPCTDGAAPFF